MLVDSHIRITEGATDDTDALGARVRGADGFADEREEGAKEGVKDVAEDGETEGMSESKLVGVSLDAFELGLNDCIFADGDEDGELETIVLRGFIFVLVEVL